MSKIAILLPKEYMLEQARNVIREDELDIDILKVIKTSDSVYEARQAVEQGAEVVLGPRQCRQLLSASTQIFLLQN